MRVAGLLTILTLLLLTESVAAIAQMDSACRVKPDTFGSGPVARVSNLTGTTFDTSYMLAMYQQHVDIAALANQMAAKSGSYEIRDLSRHIADEQNDLNRKLAAWYGQPLNFTLDRSQAILAELNCPNNMSFTTAATSALIALLAQSKQVSDVAQVQGVSPELKDQARIVSRSAHNEIAALQLWLRTGNTHPWEHYYYHNMCNPIWCSPSGR